MSRPRNTLRTLLTEATPISWLSTAAMRQLAGYYSDWRRSRDILSNPESPRDRRRSPRVPEMLSTNGLRFLRLR